MNVNLTAKPYYDDFDSLKNYHRILFKPGVPVQARELTQLQSIIQDQIKKFAGHIFVDGTRTSKENPQAVIIDQTNYFASKLVYNSSANVESYVGLFVAGETSGTIGKVEYTFDRNNPTIGDPDTIVFKRIKGTGEFNPSENLYFYDNIISANAISNIYIASQVTELDFTVYTSSDVDALSNEITINSTTDKINTGDYVSYAGLNEFYVVEIISATSVRVNKNLDITGTGLSINFIRKSTSKTCVVTVSDATYYKNGFFINVPSQSIVPEKYTQFPTKSVIYRYNEEIINYDADLSLLDPAFGNSNYLAPGADRLKVTLDLDTVDLTSTNTPDISTTDYIEIVRFLRGNYSLMYSAVNTTYAALGDVLADRTYNESGNYIISPFNLKSSGSSSSGDKNRFLISSGHAIVGGYDIKTADKTEIIIPKARTTATELSTDVSTYFGTYILIDAPQFGFYNPEKFTLENYWECHTTTNRNAMSNTATLVGYITPKFIKYDSGTQSNAIYRLHWYDFSQANASLTFDSIRSIISVRNELSSRSNNNGTYASPLFFANVAATGLSNTSVVTGYGIQSGGPYAFSIPWYGPIYSDVASPTIFETTPPSRYVFETGKSAVKGVDNVSVVYSRLYSNVTLSSGYATITVASPSKFVGPVSTTMPASFARQYYSMVVKQKIDSLTLNGWTAGAYVPTENLSLSIDSSQRQLTIRHSNTQVSAKVDMLVTLETNNLDKRVKTLYENYASIVYMNETANKYGLPKADIFSLKGVYRIGSNVWAGTYSSSNTYSSGQVVSYGPKVYLTKQTTTNTISNSSIWTSLSAEPLSQYTLDDGQRDTFYDWGSIINLSDRTAPIGNVIVIYDYFSHTGTGVLDVTSYPANTYSRIPTYKSTVDSKLFNLRDCLDFRPKREDQNIYGANGQQYLFDTSTVTKPDPMSVPGTQIDLEYYLPRIDQLYLNTKDTSVADPGNKFSIKYGTPNLNPLEMLDESDRNKQLIATIISPPYTASANDVKFIYKANPRYTMSDIGTIDSRLTTLEKSVKKQNIEIVALNNKVYDRNGALGNVLYTTGIFVEDFSGFDSALVTDPHFTVAINTEKKEARPSFSGATHKLFFVANPTNNINFDDDIITMPYTEESFIDQTNPSALNVVSYGGGDSGPNWLAAIAVGAVLYAAQVGIVGSIIGALASLFVFACFKGTTKIVMADGTIKNIKDVKVGEYVLNKDRTASNKVMYISKGKYTGKLYSPDMKNKAFGTLDHPLFIDGKLSSTIPENSEKTFPWLGKIEKIENVVTDEVSNEFVYNLYVDGDGTYIVNGYGTTSIYGTGGAITQYFTDENISEEERLSLYANFKPFDSVTVHGWYIANTAIGKLGSRKINKLFANSLSKNKPTTRKIALSLFKLIGNITNVIKGR
jgi:hypothetical protein